MDGANMNAPDSSRTDAGVLLVVFRLACPIIAWMWRIDAAVLYAMNANVVSERKSEVELPF